MSEIVLAEVGWYRTLGLRANEAPDGQALDPDIIVHLPKELIQLLQDTCDAHARTIDLILDHLQQTGQARPPIPAKEA